MMLLYVLLLANVVAIFFSLAALLPIQLVPVFNFY